MGFSSLDSRGGSATGRGNHNLSRRGGGLATERGNRDLGGRDGRADIECAGVDGSPRSSLAIHRVDVRADASCLGIAAERGPVKEFGVGVVQGAGISLEGDDSSVLIL